MSDEAKWSIVGAWVFLILACWIEWFIGAPAWLLVATRIAASAALLVGLAVKWWIER